MLDESTRALLSAVNTCCGEGGCKIIDDKELLRFLPTADTSDISSGICFLAEKKLIELNYAEEGTYCIRTLPAGRSYLEREERELLTRLHARRETFFASLLGAFLGGAVAAVIAFLLGAL